LWKKAEANHVMQWPSPWGAGYPGWHLECSVMSTKYLGKTIDIHGGGLENQFPHHECEIAQSEAANGVQFVRYWVHHNMVTVDGQKMGKSLNNFITLKQAFSGAHERLTRGEGYEPLAVRFLILNSHYRSPLDFSDAALFAAQTGYAKLRETVLRLRIACNSASQGEADSEVTEQLKQLRKKFEAAMNDDLNTPVAISVIFELVRLSNKLVEAGTANKGTLDAVDGLFRELGGGKNMNNEEGCLGIVKAHYREIHASDVLFPQTMDILLNVRKECKSKGDFTAADDIRARLDKAGIVLEDRPDGTKWRWK
ncbi:MAG: DALR domain-containing protein, partial [Planctomycetota bacterium]